LLTAIWNLGLVTEYEWPRWNGTLSDGCELLSIIKLMRDFVSLNIRLELDLQARGMSSLEVEHSPQDKAKLRTNIFISTFNQGGGLKSRPSTVNLKESFLE